jgi:hypothetical protein
MALANRSKKSSIFRAKKAQFLEQKKWILEAFFLS